MIKCNKERWGEILNKKFKFLSLLMSVFLLIIFGQSIKAVAASSGDYDIISNCDVTVSQAKAWAKSKGATDEFVDLADLYWQYYSDHGNVNPGIAYVQSAKETGYGNFGGVINASYHNPCGLKTAQGGDDSDPNAHMSFETWDKGVQAHFDHLALYAGAEGYPRRDTYDSRHFVQVKGRSTTTNGLGGSDRWCPSSTYGIEVSKLYSDLLVFSGLKAETIKEETSTTVPNAQSVNSDVNTNINISSNIGWRQYDNVWYFYNSDKTLATGWINPDNNWYYLNSDGQMQTGWLQIGDTWYYLNDSGIMVTGWQLIDNSYYYFQGNGDMVTGFRSINGNYYLLSNDGDMLTGYQTVNGTSYYFNEDGSLDLNQTTSNNNDSEVNNNSNSSNTTNTQNNSKVIVVDPGHARGNDSGVKVGNYDETELDMQVALKLQAKLQSLGYTAILTRGYTDTFGSLTESLAHRADVANNNNAAFFISIHHNAVDGIPTASGVETYYSVHEKDISYGGGLDSARLEKSKVLAKLINDNIANKLNARNRGAKSDSDTGVGNLFVLRNTNMPAVLVETGFLTNEEEAARCADSTSQQIVADAIAEVIVNNI